MPEDLNDKLIDFELMLEGFCANVSIPEDDKGKTRLLSYWYSLKDEIEGNNGK
jgi:hypothetical protein